MAKLDITSRQIVNDAELLLPTVKVILLDAFLIASEARKIEVSNLIVESIKNLNELMAKIEKYKADF